MIQLAQKKYLSFILLRLEFTRPLLSWTLKSCLRKNCCSFVSTRKLTPVRASCCVAFSLVFHFPSTSIKKLIPMLFQSIPMHRF